MQFPENRDARSDVGGTMATTNARTVVAVGTALMMLGASKARAITLRTGSLQPGANQKLVCTVINPGVKPIGIAAQIVDRFGANTTDFAATEFDESGTILTTLRVESSNPNARYCLIVVRDGK